MEHKRILLTGVALVVLYCVLASFADAATRIVAKAFDAPQLFFFSGAVGMALSYLMMRRTSGPVSLRPKAPWLLALRSGLFVLSCAFYFYAFGSLVFVEVFAFIALVPIIAGLLSGPVLGESVRPFSWVALLGGTGGMFAMYPDGLAAVSMGHMFALLGAITGASSMVLARLISRYDSNSLLQVFYPNLAIFAVMGCILPFTYAPMGLSYTVLVLGYGVILFAARWVLVLSLVRLPAYVATPLINIQFVIMLLIGYFAFDEVPTLNVLTGAVIIIAAGVMLVVEQYRKQKRADGARDPSSRSDRLAAPKLPKLA